MPRNRFVVPGTTRVELSDGDWIELKEQITYGEKRRLAGSMFRRLSDDDEAASGLDLDLARYGLLRILTWVSDWSFVGADKKPVPLSLAAISGLDPDTASEIDAAVTAHIEALEASKNTPTPPGEPTRSG